MTTSRYSEWAASVLCWDGILPMAMVAAPVLVNLLVPRQAWIGELVAVFLPITAFFVRLSIGRLRLASGAQRSWQGVLFFLAILILVLFDAVLILFCVNPRIAQPADWAILWGIFAAYISLMAIALFPFESNHSSADSCP